MQVSKKNLSETKVQLTVKAAEAYLVTYKQAALEKLAGDVKIQGFRPGTAPLNLIEKNVSPQLLQSEFVEEAINSLYPEALRHEKVRPIDNPKITLKKFVPFSELEFEAEVEIIAPIKLADYKKIKKSVKEEDVKDKEIDDVIKNLLTRSASSKEVNRAAKSGDKVWIDFEGKDKDGKPIKGAAGKDYPLLLGSKTFIPGFEENLEGLKKGQTKSFELTFPKDYGVKTLSGQKVEFKIEVNKVEELSEPKLDDKFAAKVGPFKTVSELKTDIKKQLKLEKKQQAHREIENLVVQEITEKSDVKIPEGLVEEQTSRLLTEFKQNLTYQGQTPKEYFDGIGTTEEKYIEEVIKPDAKRRVKAGLVLAEVAEAENLSVSEEELDQRMQQLKSQYQDAAMQAELNKPEARRDIASRLLTEKTVHKLVDYAIS